MYYLRQYETIIFQNSQYVHIPTSLTKADCYGIMKRAYVQSTIAYDSSYVTQYNSRAIKHPYSDLWCIEFTDTTGVNPIYLPFLETKEALELDEWVIDPDDIANADNADSVDYSEVPQAITLADRISAMEEVVMMMLV